MDLNPTPLEILILLMVSLGMYIWACYQSQIRNWWKELWKKQRAGGN
jgi:hypothetical protein